ncbi:MAG: glycosyltransferase family 39 protein [bacterium]
MSLPDASSLPKRPWPWIPALILFALGLIWFGRDLNFSAYAHPDERNKVNQIVQSYYNFNHPLLMLNSARLVAAALGKTEDFESVKIIGRFVSVFYASLSVAILALAMGRFYGLWVGIASGLFIMANPHLFEFAHYFKEEPTVLFGISLTLCFMLVYSERTGPLTACLCGAAAGLAFSGKYAGIIVMPFALYVVLALSDKKWRDGVLFISAFCVLFFLINLPALLSINHAVGSLDREVVRLSGAQQEVQKRIPHGIYTNRYWQSATPVLAGLLIVYAIGIYRRQFRLHPFEWALTLTPVAYFLILSFIPVTSNRYFLPCGVLAACLSAAGLGLFLSLKYGRVLAMVLLIFSLAWQLPELIDENKGFKMDHLGELKSYLETNLPAEAVLLVSQDASIPPLTNFHVKYQTLEPGETLESLRQKGFTHILIFPRSYQNFLNQAKNRTRLEDSDFQKMKLFYESLFVRAVMLRDWKEGANTCLAKAMTLFSLQENGARQ